MKSIAKLTTTVIATLCATAAVSADYKVRRSLELPVPTTEAWHMIGDFCDIDDWHPKITGCSVKVMDGSLVRVLSTEAGDDIIEKRIAQEAGLSYTYKTIQPALPVENFIATFSIENIGNSLIVWSANFSSDDPAMEQAVVEELESGMSAIEAILKTLE